MSTAHEAIVLAGHGSRSDEANASLLALARTLGDELGVPVFAGYLEMAEPTIPAALRAARDAGAERLVLLPFFLSPGMHVRRDLEEIAEASRAELGVPIDVADFLGAHPAIPRLLADIARAACGVRTR
jgi:sirohydrochlorin ferrochelatase